MTSSPLSKFKTIEELRAFHDQRFIRLAYRSILGREPEQAILDTYRRNISPAEVLEGLRNSEEGKARWLTGKSISHMSKLINQQSTDVELDLLKELSSYTKDIYYQLKTEAANHAKGKV